MAQIQHRSGGFAVSTYPEDIIEANAADRVRERDPHTIGFVDNQGHVLVAGWEELNRDIATIERNALAWLRKTFAGARDEGHTDDDLVGTFWFDPENAEHVRLVELGREERIDMVDHSYGDFADSALDGVSAFGASVLGGAIHFFDVDVGLDDQKEEV